MKKYLLILLMMFGMLFSNSIDCSAQTYYYCTTGFSIKYKTSSGWTDWSEWKDSNMKMKIDFDDDIIVIYSPEIQRYLILEHVSNFTDESGGQQSKYKVIDQDDDIGYIRLRIERNGNSQLYVDFTDVTWVYNVRRIEQ